MRPAAVRAALRALAGLLLARVARAAAPAPEERELALCLAGQLRGVCSPEDFASLFDVFLSGFASVDVFLLFPRHSCEEDIELFGAAATVRHPDIRFLELCQDELLDQEEEQGMLQWLQQTEEGQSLRYFNATRYVNSLRMSRYTAACMQAIQAKEQESVYKFVARARPDVLWHSFIGRDELEAAVPPLILTNFVAMPIQGVVEDSFAIGAWPEMKLYSGFRNNILINRRRLTDIIRPWCVVHATLRSKRICSEIYTENQLEEYLRRDVGLQIQKRRGICFDRVYPCMEPRTQYCARSPRHALGFVDSRPASFTRLDRDFFLTATADYADYDSVLAARLGHFLHAEGLRLGHPARVLDLGCGRGSYVEALSSWGLPVVGVDGDAVLVRSLAHHALRWDLARRLDLDALHGPGRKGGCTYSKLSGGKVGNLAKLVAREMGVSEQVRLEIRRGLPGMGFKGTLGGGPASIDEVLRFLCCLDARCAGFNSLEDAALILKWVVGPPEEEGLEPMDFGGTVTVRGQRVWLEYPADRQVPFTQNDVLGWHGASHVKFSQADWVISLGLGSEVPRSAEAGVVENIVRLAAEGAIVSWGNSARNPRSQADVLELLEANGLSLDLALTRELRLFAGLAHGRAHGELLALRRKDRQEPVLGEVELVKEMGVDESASKCVTGAKARPGSSSYGSLGPGRIWVSGACRGIFRSSTAGADVENTICSTIELIGWTECALNDVDSPDLERKPPPPAPHMNAIDVGRLYDTADHLVPEEGVWTGDARLNVVFFKLARALASPARAAHLWHAWSWLWTTSWHGLVHNPPEAVPKLSFFAGRRGPVTRRTVAWQFSRVLEALRRLACALAWRRAALAPPPDTAGRDWAAAAAAARGALGAVVACELQGMGARAAGCLGSTVLWDAVEAARAEIWELVAGEPLESALASGSVFVETILPALRDVMLSKFLFEQSQEPPPWSSLRELTGMEDQSGCGAGGAGGGRPQHAPLWARDTAVGWYLYRLAALEPEM